MNSFLAYNLIVPSFFSFLTLCLQQHPDITTLQQGGLIKFESDLLQLWLDKDERGNFYNSVFIFITEHLPKWRWFNFFQFSFFKSFTWQILFLFNINSSNKGILILWSCSMESIWLWPKFSFCKRGKLIYDIFPMILDS